MNFCKDDQDDTILKIIEISNYDENYDTKLHPPFKASKDLSCRESLFGSNGLKGTFGLVLCSNS